MDNKEHIESFIRQSLDKLEVQPGIPSFELTMKKLEAAQKEKRKKRFFFWFFAGIAAMGITAVAALYLPGKTVNPLAIHTENSKQAERHQLSDEKTNVQKQEHLKEISTVNKEQYATKEKPKKNSNSPNSGYTSTPLPANHSAVAVAEPSIEKTNMIASEPDMNYLFLELNKTTNLSAKALPDTALKNAALVDAETTLPKDTPDYREKDFVWYIGAGFTPQLTRYKLPAGHKADDTYSSFQDTYYTERLHQARSEWSYSTQLKAGLSYKRKWMFGIGLGYQVFRYKEEVKEYEQTPGAPSPPPVIVTSVNSGNGFTGNGGNSFTSSATAENLKHADNRIRYLQGSLEAARLFNFRYFSLKAGAQFSVSHILRSRVLIVEGTDRYTWRTGYSGDPLSKWICTPAVSAALVKNLGHRIQLQAGPNAFYNLHSMFSKGYIISQKPYGLGFDVNLMIRLN